MATIDKQPVAVALRVNSESLHVCIERLDASPSGRRGIEQRRSPRFRYREGSLILEIFRDQTVANRYVVAARNLSRNGIALVAQQFIYPRHACRLTLTPVIGKPVVLDGVVTRCRYLPGQGSLHEVGVQFRTPIDVTLFIPDARLRRILLADAAPQTHQLFDSFLAGGAELTCASSAADAAAAALSQDFDLLLVDLDSEVIDAFTLIRELRRAGTLGAIVGLAVEGGDALRRRCADVGCTGYLARPVTREALSGLLASLRTEPLLSTLAGDESLAPLIADFVRQAREHAKTLTAALENDDHATLQRVARVLRAHGGSYGFASISGEATLVESLATVRGDKAELRAAVADLVHLCLIARAAPAPGDGLPLIDD